jgi:hypothetical protein
LQLVPRSYCCGRPVACSCPGVVFSTIPQQFKIIIMLCLLYLGLN